MGWEDNRIELTPIQQEAIDASLRGIKDDALGWLREQGIEPVENGTQAAADLWRQVAPKTPQEVEAWYAREDVSRAMIVDLCTWHDSDPNVRLQNSSILAHTRGPRVVDFGAGIGTLAIALALAGCQVECVEIGPWLRRFAQDRAARLGAHLTFVDELVGEYDTIVSMDTAEHLPWPADLLEMAHAHLGPEGVLAMNWVFWQDENVPQHVRECSPPAREFHRVRNELFTPPLESAWVTSNHWPSIHRKK